MDDVPNHFIFFLQFSQMIFKSDKSFVGGGFRSPTSLKNVAVFDLFSRACIPVPFSQTAGAMIFLSRLSGTVQFARPLSRIPPLR
jgi:hypothetical protein